MSMELAWIVRRSRLMHFIVLLHAVHIRLWAGTTDRTKQPFLADTNNWERTYA